MVHQLHNFIRVREFFLFVPLKNILPEKREFPLSIIRIPFIQHLL